MSPPPGRAWPEHSAAAGHIFGQVTRLINVPTGSPLTGALPAGAGIGHEPVALADGCDSGAEAGRGVVIRRVAELGHPVLRQVAEPVPESELASRGLRALVADLVDTMRDYEGVGIAAPQVYVPQRLFVMEVRS